jgi:hypothetical protein
MLTRVQIVVLKGPSLPGVLNGDTDQGFELIRIKAAYVIERLNEVFGPCGIGWRYAHSPFEKLHIDNRRAGVSPGSPSSTGSRPTTIVLAVSK